MRWIGTAQDLADFEDGIAAEFNAGEIPFPVHLESGNEQALIDIFEDVEPDDWIFGTWRLHLKAMLKGVPPDELRAAIHRGESMALCFPEYRVYGSAIAGGIIPTALGAAMAVKRRGGSERVWLFVGDMMAQAGVFGESVKYAENFGLPLSVVIEDNGVSVCTDTRQAWGRDQPITHRYPQIPIRRYHYRSKYPHAGAGKRVQF